MPNSVKKYIKYIEDLIEQIGNVQAYRIIEQKRVVITNETVSKLNDWYFYQSLRKCLLSEGKEEGQLVITDQFSAISKSLLFSPLNAREKTDVIFYLINRNIDLLDDSRRKGLIKYNRFSKYGMNPEMVDRLFESGEVEYLLYTEDSLLDKQSREMKKIVNKCVVFLDDDNPFVQSHKAIKKYYLDKETTYEEEDINIVCCTLLGLEIDKSLCDTVKGVLQTRLEKRRKIEYNEEMMMRHTTPKERKVEKQYLSEKEYKNIKKEVLTYFDIHTGMPTRDLSIEEIRYCADLLFKIEVEDGIIRALYDRSEYAKKLLEKADESPITTYLEVYDKLKFYEKRIEIEDDLTLLDSYFQETFLSDSKEYAVWKQAIGEELCNLLEKIPAGFKYEIQMKPPYENGNIKVKTRNTK